MTEIALDFMSTCPKCKIIIQDLIKAHFLGGAVGNPLAIHFRMIDPISRGNMWDDGPFPIAPTARYDNKFVMAVPQIRTNKGRIIYVGKMKASNRQVFRGTSYFMQYIFDRIGHKFQPPILSEITARYNKEVIETAQMMLGKR